jgi:hypothetical protein
MKRVRHGVNNLLAFSGLAITRFTGKANLQRTNEHNSWVGFFGTDASCCLSSNLCVFHSRGPATKMGTALSLMLRGSFPKGALANVSLQVSCHVHR